jgi:hypothetical protein
MQITIEKVDSMADEQDPVYAAIHDAVARLAGVCDFAVSQDGQGFNASDAWLGHVLASMPVDAWTPDVALAAWDMLGKYRDQLGGLGVGYGELPLPPGAAGLVAARREQARKQARELARQWRHEQYRAQRSYVRCDGEGEQVVLAFAYDPVLVEQVKAIEGRRFDWDTKASVFPFTRLPQVVAFADAHGIGVAPEVRALAGAAAAQAEQEAAQPEVRTDQAGRVVLSAPFDPRLNQALRALNGGRSTWDAQARVHRLPVHRDPAGVLALAGQFGLRVSEDARAAAEAEVARQERNRAVATAVEAAPVPVPGLAEGMALKPQQYPVVRFALEHRRVLIGDGMGWGKTLSSLAAVAADGAYPAIVVCRPSLTLNWVGEIRRFFPGLRVWEAPGTVPRPVPGGTDVVVIGSAALAAKPRETKDGTREFGWVTALTAAVPKALIIDEGQDTKERGANRSQACEQLATTVIKRDGLILDLTGTAILNRPRELCQQLTILGRITEFGGPKAFLWRYCLSQANEWGASYDGARNLSELHGRLLAWGIMVRRSDDAALGLPPCREHVLRIPSAELDPAVMAQYRRAEANLTGFLAEQAREIAKRLGADPSAAAVRAVMRARAAEHLVALNTLRQLAGQAKRGYITAWVGERVAAGEKVMVAAHHRAEVDAYAARFGGLKLQGGQPVAEKEAAKAAFQHKTADEAPVIAVAIGAGGAGHTLTAARIGIQAEQAWTPGETQQTKKRLHRIGQDRPVDYYITVAEHTIDEHLWAVVSAKQAALDAVLDGKSDEVSADDEACVAAEVAWRLAQQGLTSTPAAQPQSPRADSRKPPGDDPGQTPGPAGAHDGDAELAAAAHDTGPAAGGPVAGSVLDDATFARMRAEAAPASRFTDPALLRDAQAVLPAVPGDWLSRVTGRAVASYRSLTGGDLALAVRAARADSAHLESLAAHRRAGQQRADRLAAEARAARAREEHSTREALKARLPVPVTVQHNWTARHLEGYVQGADHIVALKDLTAGRYHRSAGDPLCWTPSRAYELRHVRPNAGDEYRIPDCKACLKHAARLARPAEDGRNPAGEAEPKRNPAWDGGTGGQAAAGPAALVTGSAPAVVVPESRATAPQQPGPGSGQAQPASTVSPAMNTRWTATCACCHTGPPGPGGILCPGCKTAITTRTAPRSSSPGGADDDGDDDPAVARGQALREAAHLYLDRGLLPVPAWAVNANGECCCRHGGDCPRPGKHPRSVHTGPGTYDYSWKPLACRTHEEIEQRFADDGEYAGGNLMLAIPEGMLVIDQDNDDGGEQAITTLAETLGELPPTLAHATPHGTHRIYRTPPGWTGRAWVGKDARNPLPAGIDLRMPGQILMAPPSRVPAEGGLATYGPVTGAEVADLPAAYVRAWTPPAPQPRAARPPAPVPPGRTDAAAAYVHARITGIVEDLAAREPGGRNAAIYTAALRVGSTLGAARSTPGAEQAASTWTDEAAEQALMDAAERNGYVGKHSAAMARAAVRSGLRNGLRSPRPLPDFNARPVTRTARPRSSRGQRQPSKAVSTAKAGQPERAGLSAGEPADADPRPSAQGTDRAQRVATVEDLARGAAAALHDAGYRASDHTQDGVYGPEGYQIRAAPGGGVIIRHVAAGRAVAGAEPSQRANRMLSEYASRLRRAGFSVAADIPGTITVTRQPVAGNTVGGSPAGDRQNDRRTRANRAAAAANEAYRARDFTRARQLVDQAAALDPSRASLWQRYHSEIEAKRLLREAQTAQTEGDQGRAGKLMQEVARLDPRLRALWDQDLPSLPEAHDRAPARASAGHGPATPSPAPVQHACPRDPSAGNRPRWPARPIAQASPQASLSSEPRQPSRDGASPVPPRATVLQRTQQRDPDPRSRAHPSGQAAGDSGPADWRDAVMQRERQEWQPKVAPRHDAPTVSAEIREAEISV